MEEKYIIRIVNEAQRKSEWRDIIHKEIAVNSYNLGVLTTKENMYTREDLIKAIHYLPYHTEYGNIVARKTDEKIEQFINDLKS